MIFLISPKHFESVEWFLSREYTCAEAARGTHEAASARLDVICRDTNFQMSYSEARMLSPDPTLCGARQVSKWRRIKTEK